MGQQKVVSDVLNNIDQWIKEFQERVTQIEQQYNIDINDLYNETNENFDEIILIKKQIQLLTLEISMTRVLLSAIIKRENVKQTKEEKKERGLKTESQKSRL